MTIPHTEIGKIKKLRWTGHSIPEISRITRHSKSTITRHIQANEMKIGPRYHDRWLDRRNTSSVIMQRAIQRADEKAAQVIDALSQRDLLLIGSSLYWAEGSKRDFTFTNTDPRMVRVFIHMLRSCFNIPTEDMKVSLRIYEDLNKKNCLTYWSKVTGVNLSSKTTISVLQGKKSGKLVFGMCRVRVRKSGWLLKETASIINRVVALSYPS